MVSNSNQSSPASTIPPSHPQHPSSKPINPLSSFLAGIAGGSASTILLYPLDLVKVRLQVDERRSAQSSPDHATRRNAARGRTICTTVRGVIKHEGYLGLYRGLSPAIIGSAASWGGFFILYEELKRQMLHRKIKLNDCLVIDSSLSMKEYDVSKDMHVDEEMDVNSNETYSTICNGCDKQSNPNIPQPPIVKLGPMEHFTASCMAGACMVALTNPLWLIKTRLQLQNSRLQEQLLHPSKKSTNAPTQHPNAPLKPPYRGLFHAAYTIVKEEGFLALYKGSIPALMLVSHGGIQFVSYEFLKGHFARTGQWKKRSGRESGSIVERLRDSFGYLIMGATSKFIASTTTYPLQVIKSRLQQRSQAVEVSEVSGEIIVTKREYAGVLDCVGKIWKNEGISGFFKGCLTNAIRVAPSAAITFVVYEWVLDVLSEM
ncbi:hypothetical protein HJC23_003001 [Cyclotella cryptica]|uniref:Mitochondrial carrier protein n=1 Tax=Cyclotella cryptica TaxID=29204 RepID=A0ABD3PT36_9STRA